MPERSGAPPAGPVLVLTPTGRDAEGASLLLERDKIAFMVCRSIEGLCGVVSEAAGAIVVADETLTPPKLALLSNCLRQQPTWSDLPVIVLTHRGIAARRALAELHVPEALGNVMFLERPLNAISLISAVRTALRARRRQRQVRDHIAERAAAAEKLRELNSTLENRVAERTEELRASEAALAQAQKMEAVGRLTGGIAHDFNNLLTAVVGSLELLQRRLEPDERSQRLIRAALQAAMRGAKLTAQLLAFSRTQKLDLRAVDIHAALAGMDELLARTTGPMVELRVQPAPEPRSAIADPNQLELAILNLAINARDAMPSGGRLTITSGSLTITEAGARAQADSPAPGRYAVISVTDTGTGMTPEIRARALEPFFTTKAVGRGTGLGLAQVYGIARQSGGDVRIASTPGQGTTVSILLPAASGKTAEAEPAPADALRPAHDGIEAGMRILVVDDDEDVRATFVTALEELGYRPLGASGGDDALRILRDNPAVKAAVVDFAMPGMDGASLAAEIRRRRPGLPLLIASGYADTAALDRVPDTLILRKPVRMADLADALARIMRPAARPAPGVAPGITGQASAGISAGRASV